MKCCNEKIRSLGKYTQAKAPENFKYDAEAWKPKSQSDDACATREVENYQSKFYRGTTAKV